MKRTIIIIIMIILSVIVGYVYEQVSTVLEQKAHPVKYREFVEKYSKEYGIRQEIIYSIINVESSYKSDAKSSKGANGLMQIIPDTFDWIMMRLGEDIDPKLVYDPETNIKYGTYCLRLLFLEFEDWDIAFAAYNAGMGTVKSWMKNPEYIKDGEIVYIPYEETRNYIVKVNRNIEAYKRLYFENEPDNNSNKVYTTAIAE